jgi:hypothetical protein
LRRRWPVKNGTVRNKILLFVFLMIVLVSSALGQESNGVKVQGRVMSLDLYKNVITVNEKTFLLNSQTMIRDEKDHSAGMSRLKPEAWVYVVGENNSAIKKLVAKRIYLLPKYIERKERHLYPFMD